MEYPRLWPWLLVGTGCKFVSGDFSGILHSINRVILKYLEHLITRFLSYELSGTSHQVCIVPLQNPGIMLNLFMLEAIWWLKNVKN